MKLRGFLPGMGNPMKNAGYRKRKLARDAMAVNPSLGLATLPSGANDLCRKGSLPSKFARAHTVKVGRIFETHDGKAYQWQKDGSVRRIKS